MANRVVVVGAGPGGVAAARRVREHAGDAVEVVMVERDGVAEYLPGTIPTLLGETSRDRWRQKIALPAVKVVPDVVDEVSGGGVRAGGRWIEADAVVAAPGLYVDTGSVASAPGVHAFWDPGGAAAASEAVRGFQEGVVGVIISSLPYRCPPAPYAMAMQLAAYYREHGREVQVVLTTPEEEPLQAIGGDIPGFLRDSLEAAGVEFLTGFTPASFAEQSVSCTAGKRLDIDLALVVPPHTRSPLLAGLPGSGPLVEVSPEFESAEPGLFVVGDASATPLPRAADAASAAGRAAADAILSRLLGAERETHLPAPECFVGHGGGVYSRISMSFPNGLPPQGSARVDLEGPSPDLKQRFEEAFARWRALRGAG